MKPLVINTCSQCNRQFEAQTNRATICSPACAQHKFRKTHNLYMDKSERECKICQAKFTPYNPKQFGCSKKCNQKISNTKTTKRRSAELIVGLEDEVPSCLICNHKSRALHAHLRNHNISTTEYKQKFNVDDSALYHHSYMKELSDRALGENNPAYQHGGKYSPFSEKFVKYKDLEKDEKIEKMSEVVKRAAITRDANDNNVTTSQYYTKRGATLEEAKELVSKHQKMFSLKKCIEKYGEIGGLQCWQDRQEKWLATLNAKTYEEKCEINRKKFQSTTRGTYGRSLIATEMFESIIKTNSIYLIDNIPETIHFHSETFNKEEKTFINGMKWYKADFYDELTNKIIEFYGDYWHGNAELYNGDDIQRLTGKKYSDIWIKDDNRLKFFERNGYTVKTVWEKSYKDDKQKVIEECLNFLKN